MTDHFHARAKRTDPDTSHDAAASISGRRVSDAAKLVLKCIAGHVAGANWMEVETETGLQRQTISPRWVELRKHGLIETRDEYVPVIVDGTPNVRGRRIVRPGWSSRDQTVWFATAAGRAYAAVMEVTDELR